MDACSMFSLKIVDLAKNVCCAGRVVFPVLFPCTGCFLKKFTIFTHTAFLSFEKLILSSSRITYIAFLFLMTSLIFFPNLTSPQYTRSSESNFEDLNNFFPGVQRSA